MDDEPSPSEGEPQNDSPQIHSRNNFNLGLAHKPTIVALESTPMPSQPEATSSEPPLLHSPVPSYSSTENLNEGTPPRPKASDQVPLETAKSTAPRQSDGDNSSLRNKNFTTALQTAAAEPPPVANAPEAQSKPGFFGRLLGKKATKEPASATTPQQTSKTRVVR